jgi:platelet-activating factor acetylhydrolase IB subunit alpha
LTCTKTLNGHEHTVSSIEFTPDGVFLLSGSRDKTIKMWEVSTGNCKKTLSGHNEWVRCVSINSSGSLFASCSDDESIIVWNMQSFSQLYTLTGHENKIEQVLFINNQIALGNIYNSDYMENFNKSLNGTVETPEHSTDSNSNNLNNLIDLNKQILEKTKKKEKINKEFLISASRDKAIKIWDVFGGSCIYTLLGHDNWVRSLTIHPNGKYLLSASDDKSIRIWELKTGRVARKINDAHERFVVSLAMNHKYPIMASGSNDQTIKIWECK